MKTLDPLNLNKITGNFDYATIRKTTVANQSPAQSLARRLADRLTIAVLALFGYEAASPKPHRIVLPMSSGVNILPNTSAKITSRPQTHHFRPERIVIGGNPERWVVNDIMIGNRSQLAQSGDIPGEMFAFDATDAFLNLDIASPGMDVVLLVTHIGPDDSGEVFNCGITGSAVDSPG